MAVSPQAQFLVDWSFTKTYVRGKIEGTVGAGEASHFPFGNQYPESIRSVLYRSVDFMTNNKSHVHTIRRKTAALADETKVNYRDKHQQRC